ncbi:hypothetical protein RJ53_05220 [Methanocalculus chunghsingensis]|uniref:DUF306 domain-containing protein n=1 Tax=Methanocalculus chunghsingensis TaxID=156457 RepID=A0A8J8B5B4_9EURY|nr:META domain-containing protein [Methanocalculus chunghsingensis]MBR1368938.1 hypothetical protein [Methanocalculus chunghsingensis]
MRRLLTITALLLGASIALVAAGCVSVPPPPPDDEIGSNLPGTTWQLSTLYVDGSASPVLPNTTITVRFDEDTIAGSAGCNQYFGSYSLVGSEISIGTIGSTLMYCGEPGVMDQEALYLSLLGDADVIAADEENLTLSAADGSFLLVFDRFREIPAIPDEGLAEYIKGSEWQLTALHYDDAVSSVISGSEITLIFDEESISGSAGCNRYMGSYSVDGAGISIGAIGATKMFCGEAGIMAQETRYLSLLGEAEAIAVDGERLVLSAADGSPLLTFKRAIESPALSLTGVQWRLLSITENGTRTEAIPERAVTATFDGERIGGSGGCNSYSAGYQIDGSMLVIDHPVSTLVYCQSPPGLMDRESRFFSLLPKMDLYIIEDGSLTLSSADGDISLSFVSGI